MSDNINEVRERLAEMAYAAGGGVEEDIRILLDDHARLQNKVAALHWCAWDRDECTVTLAFKSEQQVIEFIGQHPARGRVQTLPAAAPAIDLEQFRELLNQWKGSEYPLSYEGTHSQRALNACIADLQALIDGQAKSGDTQRLEWLMRNISGAELRRLNVWTDASCDRTAIDKAMQPTNGEGES